MTLRFLNVEQEQRIWQVCGALFPHILLSRDALLLLRTKPHEHALAIGKALLLL
jgi:hypothetical protein